MKFKRVIIKLSGEALSGINHIGVDISELDRIVQEIKMIVDLGVQVGIVVGGGNLFRGKQLVNLRVNRITADYVGMLSTIMNSLLLCDSMNRINLDSCVMSSVLISQICEQYNFKKAIKLLNKNKIVIFSGGLGNPCFTTDSAACLRAIEVKADIILKGTTVNGVYSNDPKKCSNAKLYEKITYKEVLNQELKVMDLSAFTLARDYKIPICVFNINKPKALYYIIKGKKEGTLIKNKI